MELVWIPDEKVWGKVLEIGSHFCLVEFTKDRILHQEYFEYDEVIDARELGIEYEVEENTEF